MYKVMAIVKDTLGNLYFPIRQEDKKADADRYVESLKALNPSYKFAIMDED